MKDFGKRAGIAAGVVLVGAGLAFPAVAFAEDSAKPVTEPAPGKRAERVERSEEHRKELAEALAKDLGVPVEKVTGSLEKFRAAQREERIKDLKGFKEHKWLEGLDEGGVLRKLKELRGPGGTEARTGLQKLLDARLDEAVEAGRLTRAQADAVLAAFEAGVLPPGGAGPRLHGEG
ncbi:hypothetical protein [Streptomyces sp. NPDC012888]|uniref:hypothetical protein n=1 Tax=Streptomyces sp. NPDC012888 TaxID=3364855 RepID=UPI00367E1AD2